MSKKVYIMKQHIIMGYHIRFCDSLTELSEHLTDLHATVKIVEDIDEVPREDADELLDYLEKRPGIPIQQFLKMS